MLNAHVFLFVFFTIGVHGEFRLLLYSTFCFSATTEGFCGLENVSRESTSASTPRVIWKWVKLLNDAAWQYHLLFFVILNILNDV